MSNELKKWKKFLNESKNYTLPAHNLVENFKNFVNKSPRMSIRERNRIQRRVMREISSKNFSKIKSWLEPQKGNSLSFDMLFDGQKRIIVPWVKKITSDTPVGKLIQFFKENGWDLDFSTGLASKTIEREIPKGPRQGEKITSVEKQRAGKLLGIFLDFMKKYEKSEDISSEVIDSGKPLYTSDEYLQIVKEMDQILKRIEKYFPIFYKRYFDEKTVISAVRHVVIPLVDFWNEKSEYYRQNPDELTKGTTEYSIIISRHPIDVLRMSDFEDIQSCHSEGGSYFKCAIAEAKGHGPIAYLVLSADLKKIDLDEEEIFADPARGIPGIRPLARLRLRKYSTDYWELAVPENRVYGQKVPGFKEEILRWARKNQTHVNADEFKRAYDDREIKRYGGSYADTDDAELFNIFYKLDLFGRSYQDYNKITHVNDDEEDDESEAEEFEEQCQDILNNAELENTWADFTIEDDGDGAYVYMSGGIIFKMPEEISELEIEKYEEDFVDWILQAFEKHGHYLSAYNVKEAIQYNGLRENSFYITYDVEDEPATPDGFSDFVTYLGDIDSNLDEIRETFVEILEDAGVISTVPSSEKGIEIHKRLASLQNFATKVDESKFLITLKNPIILDKRSGWKNIDDDILEELRKEYEKNIGKALDSYLNQLNNSANWKSNNSDSEPIETRVEVSFELDKVVFRFFEKYEILNFKNVEAVVAYFEMVDKKYAYIEHLVTDEFMAITNKYKEEIAGQMRLPVAAESRNVDQKMFENWRKYRNG